MYLTEVDASNNQLNGSVSSGFLLPLVAGAAATRRGKCAAGSGARAGEGGAAPPCLTLPRPRARPPPLQLSRLNLANNDFSGTLSLVRGAVQSHVHRVRPARGPCGPQRASCAARRCARAGQPPALSPTRAPPPPKPCPPCRLAYNLRELNLVNNSGIVGRLPNAAASLIKLIRVGLDGTGLSCVPDGIALEQAEAREAGRAVEPHRCAADKLLPCFLEFKSYDVPLGGRRGR